MVLAFSLQAQVEKYGAYVGIAAFFGLAVLTLLYFSQARETKRLREWAGRAPERALELEQRVVTQATAAVSRRPGATALPQRPAPPRRLAEMPAPPPAAAAQAATGGQATELAEAVPADPETNGNAPAASEGSVPVVPEPANGSAPPAADAVESDGDAPADAEPAEESTEAGEAPAAGEDAEAPAVAGAPPADAAEDDPAAPEEEPAAAEAAVREPAADETGDEEPAAAPVPRATPVQGPIAPRPAPMPLRQSQPSAAAGRPAARRPGRQAARRPAKPPREGRSAGTIALLVGLGVLILGGGALLLSQLGGDGTPTKPNQTAQPATQSVAPTTTQDSVGQGTSTTPAAETNVAVLNGTTFNGLAGQLQDKVAAQGFQRGAIATNTRDQSVAASTVYYATGFRTQGLRVARLLSIRAVKPLDDETKAVAPQADIVVLAGADKASP